MTYVKRAKEIHAASADAKTYSENLKAALAVLLFARDESGCGKQSSQN